MSRPAGPRRPPWSTGPGAPGRWRARAGQAAVGVAALGMAAFPGPAVAQAKAQASHEHGVARLRVAVEGELLELRLEAPLHSLLGFESAPRTARQRQAVRDMAAQLRQPQLLFVPSVEAACSPTAVELESPALDPGLLAPVGSPAASAAAGATAGAGAGRAAPAANPGPRGQEHAELAAVVAFRCAKPQSLTGLQVKLFAAFAGLAQVDAEIATTKGESGARLSPNRTGLSW